MTPSGDAARPERKATSSSGGSESTIERWVRLGTSIVAPTTLLTALLLYFGYVATTTEFGYFGITLGTLGLSTQDLVLRSIAALYVPLGGLLILLLLLTGIHHVVARWLKAPTHRTALRYSGSVLVLLGVAGVVRGVRGVIFPEVSRNEPLAVSPLSLGFGVLAIGYGWYVRHRSTTEPSNAPGPTWSHRAALAFAAGLVTLSIFWASSSFAGAYGRGRAVDLASRLQEDRPRVTLDTTERLFVVSSDDSLGVVETRLEPVEEGQRFRFRYTGLRLLVQAQGRMFLLPDRWNVDAGYTLVIPVGDDVRFLVYR